MCWDQDKKLPELNDEFAKDVSDATSLDELKTKIRESLEHERDHRHKDLQREKVIGELVKLHDFPVPETLVEHQMDVRLERVVRSLAQQGVDPPGSQCGLGEPAPAPGRTRQG